MKKKINTLFLKHYIHMLLHISCCLFSRMSTWARILVQVTIYRRPLIGRDGHLDQSEAYDIS